MVRFDLQQLRARLAKVGRPVETVVSLERQAGRWLLVRYLIGLTIVGYLYFLEGMFLRVLGPLDLPGVIVTVLLPVPYVVLAAVREQRGARRRAIRDSPFMRSFLRRNEQPIVAALMLVVWSGGYFSSAYFTESGESHSLAVSLDRAIPVVAPFVWIYLTVYMSFILPFLLIRDPRFFRLCALSYLSVIAVSIAAFVVYPVRYERSPVVVDSLSTWAVSVTYAFDSPVNCFPSMHASVAMMAALIMLEVSTAVGILALLHTFLIGASTLFIKQHYILDIIGGFALAVVMYSLFFRQRIMDVLAKNVAQLEAAIETIVNGRIDARVRLVLEQHLDDVARELREHLEEREHKDGEEVEARGRKVDAKR